MGLITVKQFGWGINGKTLDLIISVPKGAILKKFFVANQNDIKPENNTRVGTEYISAIQNTQKGMTLEVAFSKLFDKIGTVDTSDAQVSYDIYRLNQLAMWWHNQRAGVGVYASINDLTFITMELQPAKYGDFKYSYECGEDNLVTVFPLYNEMAIKLNALQYAKSAMCSCECVIPREFEDKILQIRAIELAVLGKDYYTASTFWNKFFKGIPIVTRPRPCNCHG